MINFTSTQPADRALLLLLLLLLLLFSGLYQRTILTARVPITKAAQEQKHYLKTNTKIENGTQNETKTSHIIITNYYT
jgi:hypothetical protein